MRKGTGNGEVGTEDNVILTVSESGQKLNLERRLWAYTLS